NVGIVLIALVTLVKMVGLHGQEACKVFVVSFLTRLRSHSLCLCEHEQTVGTIVLILRFLSPRFSDGACFGFVLPTLEGDLGLPLGNCQSFFGSLHGGSTFTQRNFKSAIGSAQFFCCELCDKSRRVGLAFLQHGNVALAFCLFTTLSS